MKSIVLVKQVPVISAMKLDPETKTLQREGVPSEVSSFDVRALLKALELREIHGGEVVVVTMGPPDADAALRHCLALGADRAIHLTDRAFAGADTLATARALALACKRENYDLILCGRHSTDAETGQVGPEIAEFLDIPQVTGVSSLTIENGGKSIRAERETDGGFDLLDCALPVLVSVTEDLAEEKFPRKAEREAVKDVAIQTVVAADLSSDHSQFGAEGSPTWVESVEVVTEDREQRLLDGEISEQVQAAVTALLDRGLYGIWKDNDAVEPVGKRQGTPEPDKSVWVVTETLNGGTRPVSFELLAKAKELCAYYGGEVGAVLFGPGNNEQTDAISEHGAEVIYHADDKRLAVYDTALYSAVLTKAIAHFKPLAVLFGSTAVGRDLAPRVAARLELGLTGDCIDLKIDANGRLLQMKPAFGGNIVAPILSKTIPSLATVRPGMLATCPEVSGRPARLEKLYLPPGIDSRIRLVSQTGLGASDAAALDTAEIAIGVGKGIGGPENMGVIQDLAEALGGAALASTRDVSDLGWLPRQHQVGITGRAIAPKLYIAVGIRGAFEHTVGVRKAGTIVAINTKPKAPIFKSCDIGIVGDYAEVVPVLTGALLRARNGGTVKA